MYKMADKWTQMTQLYAFYFFYSQSRLQQHTTAMNCSWASYTQGACTTDSKQHTNQAQLFLSVRTHNGMGTRKGSRKKGIRKKYVGMIADIPQPHFQRDKRKKQRKCGRCGLYDTSHNAATCERAQQQLKNGVVKWPRGRPRGSGRGNATTEHGMQ
jgi:hypothetical protein